MCAKKIDEIKPDDSMFPEHVPIVPYDVEKEREKEEARKLAKNLRKSGKPQAVIVTKNGVIKKASELNYQEQEDEIVRCAANPIYFIETYLTIFDQTQGIGGMIVPFVLFDFQKELINSYKENRFVIANKYRQAGISTTTCGYIAWYIMFNKNRQVAIVADRLETARDEIMGDVVDFIDGCPAWLRPKTGKSSLKNLKDTQKLKVYDNESKLGAFSAKGGLRGYTPTLIFWDETAWTEKGDKFWTAAFPTLQTGGRAIMVSTPSGLDAVFYKNFKGGREGKNQFRAVELWWFNDPRYNEGLAWYKNKGKTNEKKLEDENWDNKKRIQLMDDGWEASCPWFEDQVANANGDMRKIAQELLCVFADATIIIRSKITGLVETLRIEDFYKRLQEQNNSCTYLYVNEYMKRKLINKVTSINIEIYRKKGALSMFNKDFPDLINEVNKHTNIMQTCALNKTLYPKLLFLKKYNGNINKITDSNNKVMVFDRESGDFISKAINSAKKSWDDNKFEMNSINECYSKEETISLLKETYVKYLGKSGNRKLIKDNMRLYKSLLFHTSHMNSLNKNLNKFSHRLFILINNIDIYCTEHSNLKHWKYVDGSFEIICGKCQPKYPSVNWFKLKYGKDWEIYHNERVNKTKLNKTNSLDWFIRKYGDDGEFRYKEYVSHQINRISELKGNRYSKISQELFWGIYHNMKNKNEIYFHELNKEYVIRIPDKYNHKNIVMMVDFKYKNKIIEYNGKYWHNSEKDKIRYDILKKMGYDIYVISSDEYNRNKKPNYIIDNSIKYLSC